MNVIEITNQNYASEVTSSQGTVILDFWAPWCGPCRMLSPILDEIAKSRPDIKVGKVNVDEQSDLAAQFNVMSIPTLVIFKDGKQVNTSVGLKSREAVEAML